MKILKSFATESMLYCKNYCSIFKTLPHETDFIFVLKDFQKEKNIYHEEFKNGAKPWNGKVDDDDD